MHKPTLVVTARNLSNLYDKEGLSVLENNAKNKTTLHESHSMNPGYLCQPDLK